MNDEERPQGLVGSGGMMNDEERPRGPTRRGARGLVGSGGMMNDGERPRGPTRRPGSDPASPREGGPCIERFRISTGLNPAECGPPTPLCPADPRWGPSAGRGACYGSSMERPASTPGVRSRLRTTIGLTALAIAGAGLTVGYMSCASTPPPRAASEEPLGSVVASTADLHFFATRDGEELRVWGGAGDLVGSVTALASPSRPGDWVALSPDGRRLVQVAEGALRLTDVVTGQARWTVEAPTIWGPPVFSPDGRSLAMAEQGHVGIVDAATGRDHRLVGSVGSVLALGERYRASLESRLSLVRRIRFSPDGRFVAAACSTSRPDWANHALFVVDLASGDVVGELHGHAEPFRFRWLDSTRLVSVDGEGVARIFTRDGRLERQTEALPVNPQALAAEGGRVYFVGRGGALRWSLESDETTAGELGTEVFALAVRDGALEVLGKDGATSRVSFGGGTSRLVSQRYAGDPEAMAARAALYLLDSPAHGQATSALEPMASRGELPYRIALAYARWRSSPGDGPALETFFGSDGLDLAAPEVGRGVLDLTSRYLDSSMPAPASALYSSWLRARAANEALAVHDALGLGLGITLTGMLGELDQDEVASQYLDFMATLWPDEPHLTLRRARNLVATDWQEARRLALAVGAAHPERQPEVDELLGEIEWYRQQDLAEDDPAAAVAEARAAVDAEPQAVGAWRVLLNTLRDAAPELLAAAAAEAERALARGGAEGWLAIGGGYRDAGQPAEAVRAYRRALAALSSEDDYSGVVAREAIEAIEAEIASLPELEAAVRAAPTDEAEWGMYLRALAAVRRDALPGAIERARASLDPAASGSWATLGFAYESAYDYDRAVASLRKSLELMDLRDDDHSYRSENLQRAIDRLEKRLDRQQNDEP